MEFGYFSAPKAIWRTGRENTYAVYHKETTAKCERAFISSDAFRILLRSIGGGSRAGRIENEDGVQLYGWRVREKDGSLSAIITDVVESSPKSRRTSITFDVDYDYAIHRDRFIRDRRNHRHFNLLGYIHSHPDNLTVFSRTDIETMAAYTRSDMEVMLSGLVTLHRGRFNLTMYAVTQRDELNMDIWHLPLTISDAEVERRMPECKPKSFGQVWCEASGATVAPSFAALDLAPELCDRLPPEAVRTDAQDDTQLGLRAFWDNLMKVPAPPERPKTSPSAENPDELSDAPEPGGPIPDAPADAPQEDVPWLAPDYHEVVYKTCHPIDVKEANEGEHGFLYGVIRNGKLHMQMIPIPEAGIPEMWFQDSPIRSMYFMSLRFMSGGFRKEGRSWVKDPLDPVDVEFGKVPIVPDGGEP